MTRHLTVTLTDAPPVRIVCDDWPIIAEGTAADHAWTFKVTVRRHAADGRVLVMGIARNESGRKPQRRGGEVLSGGGSAAIAAAIHRVANWIGGYARVASRAIALLPAEDA